MTESPIALHSTPGPLSPTPRISRQDRIEASFEQELRRGGPRSQLREQVNQYVDMTRVQGWTPEQTIARLKSIAARALRLDEHSAVTSSDGSHADHLALVAQWCMARFRRAD